MIGGKGRVGTRKNRRRPLCSGATVLAVVKCFSGTLARPRFPEINESTAIAPPTVTNPVVENIKIPGYNVQA